MPKTMKKEFTTLLQFVLIAVFVGCGYFGLLLLHDITVSGLWDEYAELLVTWILSFIVLSLIILATYFTSRKKDSAFQTSSNSNNLIEKEAVRTVGYIILAVVSIPITFHMTFLFNLPPNISINTGEAWRNVREVFLVWLIGFSVLSLLRLGIIYIKSKFFQNKYIP